MLTKRGYMGACTVNGKIYVMGGSAPGNGFSSLEEYDPESDTWTKKASMSTVRCYFAACAVNGKIYAIGGWKDWENALLTVEEYDPTANKWTRKADMPAAKGYFGSAVVNDKIYIIGGTPPPPWSQPAVATVEEYDPATDTWTRKADMLAPRSAFATSAVNGKIYVFGGIYLKGDGKVISSMEEYDPATDTWSQRPDPPNERYSHSSSAVDERIYIIGGRGGQDINFGIVPMVEEYVPGSLSQVDARGKMPTKWGEIKSD